MLSTDWKLGAWNAAAAASETDGAHSLQRAGAASLDGPETILGVICKCAMQIWMTAGPPALTVRREKEHRQGGVALVRT